MTMIKKKEGGSGEGRSLVLLSLSFQLVVLVVFMRTFLMLGWLGNTKEIELGTAPPMEERPAGIAQETTDPARALLAPRNSTTCGSPELDVPWMFGKCPPSATTAYSHTSPTTCGLCGQKNYPAQRFEALQKRLAKKQRECNRLVVYGVALGETHLNLVLDTNGTRTVDGDELLKVHNRCFFTFVLQEELGSGTFEDAFQVSGDGLDYLVPISKKDFPYENMRRNVKLLKMHPHLLFPWAQRVIWQDTKFRRWDFESMRPSNYFDLFEKTIERNQVCVTFFGIPIHKNTFGKANVKQPGYIGEFHHHCEAIVEAQAKRPTVTDSGSAIFNQCELYKNAHDDKVMTNGMIDSAVILWDQRTSHCNSFSSDLACTWSDEIQCHGDRDQVSFPYALLAMGVEAELNQDPAHQDTIFYAKNEAEGTKAPMLQIVQSECHWYYNNPHKCINSVLATGAASE